MQRYVVAEFPTAVKTPAIERGLKLTIKKPAVAGFLFRCLLQHAHNGFDDVEKHNRQERTYR